VRRSRCRAWRLYSEALMLVESSKFRAQTIEGVRAFVGFSGKGDL
jgi:hypothetical protein